MLKFVSTSLVAIFVGVTPAFSGELSTASTSGTFTELMVTDPPATNALAAWLGSSFTAQLSWSTQAVQQVDLTNPEFDRAWQLNGNGGLSVSAQPSFTSTFNYLGVTKNWAYDGSLGLLPAGTYEVLTIFGSRAAAGGQRYEWSIDLIGTSGMLPGGTSLPSAATINTSNVELVGTYVALYDSNGSIVGGVESNDVSATRLNRLQLTVTPVPEPSAALLLLLGLGGLAVFHHRHKNRQAHQVGASSKRHATDRPSPSTYGGLSLSRR